MGTSSTEPQLCAVCDNTTTQACSGCKESYFCSVEHQKLVSLSTSSVPSTFTDSQDYRSGRFIASCANRRTRRFLVSLHSRKPKLAHSRMLEMSSSTTDITRPLFAALCFRPCILWGCSAGAGDESNLSLSFRIRTSELTLDLTFLLALLLE